MSVTVSLGDGSKSTATADLVFTHPYGPLPPQLIGKPSIINLFGNRKSQGEAWIDAKLHDISTWGSGLRNTVYVANLDVAKIDLTDLIEVEETPNHGFMPLELPLRLLSHYALPGITVWDGFMGRGTIGKACIELGMNYIGIDNDPKRVATARAYLGV